MKELSIGELFAMYFDETALRLPDYRLNRIQAGGDRFYFRTLADDFIEFYPGITTITHRTLPTPHHLLKWYADKGYDEAIEFRDERAAYGTLLHACIAEYCKTKRFDLKRTPAIVQAYAERERLGDVPVGAWVDDLCSDLVAFDQWYRDYDVQPLAVEISLATSAGEMPYAGTVDFPCMISVDVDGFWGEVYKTGDRKGEPKKTKRKERVLAVVDFKSGRRSYAGNLHNAAQLTLCRRLLQDNFPDTVWTYARLFNWSPKEWTTTPTYHFTEQTDVVSDVAADLLLRLYRELHGRDIGEKRLIEFTGELSLDDADNAANYRVETLKSVVQRHAAGELDANPVDYLDIEALLNPPNA